MMPLVTSLPSKTAVTTISEPYNCPTSKGTRNPFPGRLPRRSRRKALAGRTEHRPSSDLSARSSRYRAPPPSQQRRQLRGSAQKIKINTNRKIILLDQLRQSIYRNKAEALFCGKAALKLCFEGAIQKKDRRLTPIQRVFFYMSLQHAESKKSAGEIQ